MEKSISEKINKPTAMKTLFLVTLLLTQGWAQAQTAVSKSFPVTAGQQIRLEFDYPQLIRITTWDKNEVVVTGTVSINGGENDDAFVMTSSVSKNTIEISGSIPQIKKLPQRITIRQGEKKIMFKSKADYESYAAAHGRVYNSMSWNTDIDIVLDIRVPRNTPTDFQLTYGIIEIRDFAGPITATSTYGGVDAALIEKSVGDLTAVTDFGQIYSNLDFKFKNGTFDDFHTVVSAKLGTGPRYALESKYGNVYLRKGMN